MTTRIYLPLTSSGVSVLVEAARLDGPLDAHAVTEALREAWPEGDEEEWEYAALAAAADHSWTLRGGHDSPRRHVLAVDVQDDAVIPGDGGTEPTAVRLTHDVVWKNVAALHRDTEDHVEGDDQELAWFATQEIDRLP